MKTKPKSMIRVDGYIEREQKANLEKLATQRESAFEHIRRALDDYFKRPEIRKLLEVK